MEEWIKKLWLTHANKMECYCDDKKKKKNIIHDNIDGPNGILLSEISQRKTYLGPPLNVELKKKTL